MKRIPVFLLTVILLTGVGCSKALPKNSPSDHVFSHRGASGEEIEHTIAAYDLAVEYGSKYIEQDLVISKDGTLYISHDVTPERLTGETTPFAELHDYEIDALRTWDGQSILRMTDVLERYGDKVYYVSELKAGRSVYEAFIQLVNESQMADHFIVQSWDMDILYDLEEVFPDMPKLYLTYYQNQMDQALQKPWIDIISVNDTLMNQENCDKVHAANKKFNVWTLNSSSQITKAIALGVDSYFTNYTAKALLLEKKYRK